MWLPLNEMTARSCAVAALLALCAPTAVFAARGQLNDRDNRPVAGAWVVATRTECHGFAHCTTSCVEVKVARTDEHGKYSFGFSLRSLDAYQLVAYREGYISDWRQAGEGAPVELFLVRGGRDRRFSGMNPVNERIAHLTSIAREISCSSAPVQQRAALVPVYQAMLREANSLARLPEQQKAARVICDELSLTQTDLAGPSPSDWARRDYLRGVAPACNAPPPDDSTQTAMLAAIRANDSEFLRQAVRDGFDFNRLLDGYNPPIISAALAGSADVVRELAASGARPDAVGQSGRTALEQVASSSPTPGPQQVAVLRALLEAGADANRLDIWGYPPLFRVAQSQSAEMFELLLEHGARVDQGVACVDSCSEQGRTALHAHPSPAQALLAIRHGANVNARTPTGYTPLMSAADLEVARLLLTNGADPNAADDNGWTPLMYAVQAYQGLRTERYREIAEMLVAHGARLDVHNQRGVDAFSYTDDEVLKERLRRLSKERRIPDRSPR
jgi:ankyrin repeat protein